MPFDLNDTIRQAESGVVSPGWELMPLKSSSALTNGIVSLVGGLLLLAGAGYLLVSGTAIVPAFLPDSMFGAQTTVIISLIETLLVLALAVGLFIYGVRSLLEMGKTQENFLILAPEGFAEKRGKKSQGAGYTEITNVRMDRGTLHIRVRSGKTIELVPSRYGNAKELQALLFGKARAAQQPGS
jgi:hypothetical protein